MRFDHCFFIYYCLCCEDQHAARHAWLLWVFVSFLNVPGRGGGEVARRSHKACLPLWRSVRWLPQASLRTSGPWVSRLFCRQCALAALRDVKLYLTEEAGQIAVSSELCSTGFGSSPGPEGAVPCAVCSVVPSLNKGSVGNQALLVLIKIFAFKGI